MSLFARSRLLALLAATAALIACEQAAKEPVRPAASRAAEVPGTLFRGNGPEPDTLDPQRAATFEAHTILRDLCEPLTGVDGRGEVVPAAAHRWTVSADGLQYIFFLRPTLRWSNGDRLLAADFVRGLQRLVDPALAAPFAHTLGVLRHAPAILAGRRPVRELGVKALSDLEIELTLERPAPYLPSLVSHPATCPAHQNLNPNNEVTVGNTERLSVWSGPYALSPRVPQRNIRLTPNTHYWNQQIIFWPAIEYVAFSDPRTELLRFRAGELHTTFTIPAELLPQVQRELPRATHVSGLLATHYLVFNLEVPPLGKNPALREALSAAIDRGQLATQVLSGTGEPAFSLVPPYTAQAAPAVLRWSDWPAAQRIAWAQARYRDAGFSSSKPLTLTLHFNQHEVVKRAMIAVATMWHDVLGVKVELRGQEFKSYLVDINAGKLGVFRSSWVADYNDPTTFLNVFASQDVSNPARFNNARFRELLAAADRLPNGEQRTALLRESESVLLDNHVIIPLYHTTSRHLVNPSIVGWRNNPLNVVPSSALRWRASATALNN